MQLQSLMADWLDDNDINLAPTTAGWYRSMAKHLQPLAHLDATEVDARSANRLLRDLLVAGYSKDLVRGVARTLAVCMRSQGYVLAGLRIPARPKVTGRKGTWSASDAARFLGHVQGDRLELAWVLAVTCGLRRGELVGLRWDAVDLEAGVIHIRKQHTIANGHGLVVCEPKGTSARTLPIGPYAHELFAALRRDGREALRGSQPVFRKRDGSPYYPTWLSQRWGQLCRRAGVPVIALHDARHTSATVGAAHGVDIKTMQDRLGHSDAKILTQIYLHVVTEHARSAAETMERAFKLRERP